VWSQDGCTIVGVSSTGFLCACEHLTDFAGGSRPFNIFFTIQPSLLITFMYTMKLLNHARTRNFSLPGRFAATREDNSLVFSAVVCLVDTRSAKNALAMIVVIIVLAGFPFFAILARCADSAATAQFSAHVSMHPDLRVRLDWDEKSIVKGGEKQFPGLSSHMSGSSNLFRAPGSGSSNLFRAPGSGSSSLVRAAASNVRSAESGSSILVRAAASRKFAAPRHKPREPVTTPTESETKSQRFHARRLRKVAYARQISLGAVEQQKSRKMRFGWIGVVFMNWTCIRFRCSRRDRLAVNVWVSPRSLAVQRDTCCCEDFAPPAGAPVIHSMVFLPDVYASALYEQYLSLVAIKGDAETRTLDAMVLAASLPPTQRGITRAYSAPADQVAVAAAKHEIERALATKGVFLRLWRLRWAILHVWIIQVA